MSLTYSKIAQRPTTFLRMCGITVAQFNQILPTISELWALEIIGKYKRPGRPYDLSIEDMMLMLLLYYRSYTTQMFIGYLFDLDAGRVCRIIRILEPLFANVMAISKTRHLSEEEIRHMIVDATEQPIERPVRGQKKWYSGKKKRHTVKTEVRITNRGRIVKVSKSVPGSVHDFALFKEEEPTPQDSHLFVDLGYLGIEKIHKNSECPYKASKNKPLDKITKAYNKALSSVRIKIENVLAQIKVFKILSDRFRNKRKRYNLKFQIISGIVNMKNGFA